MEKKKNKIKLILPLFVAVFCLALFPFSINKVKAESYDDITTFYLWGDSSFEFTYTDTSSLGSTDVMSLPFTRLNTTNRLTDNFQWYYGDYYTSFNYLTPYESTQIRVNTFSIVSNNFFVPLSLINNCLLGSRSNVLLNDYDGYNIHCGLVIEYLGADYSQKTYAKYISLDAVNSSYDLTALTTDINTASFYHFNYSIPTEGSQNFGFISNMEFYIAQVDYGTEGATLDWSLNLNMFDSQLEEFYFNYQTYLDTQDDLMGVMIFNYNNDISIFRTIVASVNDVLQIEILPSFRIFDILLLAITIPLTVWLLKAWLGG